MLLASWAPDGLGGAFRALVCRLRVRRCCRDGVAVPAVPATPFAALSPNRFDRSARCRLRIPGLDIISRFPVPLVFSHVKKGAHSWRLDCRGVGGRCNSRCRPFLFINKMLRNLLNRSNEPLAALACKRQLN